VVEAAAVEELLELLGESVIDTTRFVVSDAIRPTDASEFVISRTRSLIARVRRSQCGENPPYSESPPA